MLMSAGLPIPRKVFGHGFMTVDGQRMSKSLGTIIDPIEAANVTASIRCGSTSIKEMSFGADGDFSWERFDERYNVDLANNLGNLVSRVAAMAHQYRQGRVRPTGETSPKLSDHFGEVADGVSSVAWTHWRFTKRRPSVSPDRRDEFTHRGDNSMGARQGSGAADRLTQVLVRRGRGHSACGRAAVADHAEIEPRNSAPRGRLVRCLPLERDGAGGRTASACWRQPSAAMAALRQEDLKENIVTETLHRGAASKPRQPPHAPAPTDSEYHIDDFMKVELRTAK